MIVYESTKAQFLVDAFDRDIEEILRESIKRRLGRRSPATEVRAWSNSLVHMARTLRHDAIPTTAGVAIEYSIPQSSLRVDFMISGIDATERAFSSSSS